ncbi:unnamed protein product [Paramecium octaurelia]|uniref:Uncharacterized protein n=1 Tax=Paramecium octaurelia TaxID=43137 RepID=A0A8S1U8J7_PAROT|nr:unnamed protein product [Paramecium octaurelia]
MNKSLLLFIGLLATTYAVTFDTTMHCACEELNQTECAKQIGYCKWSTACETVEYTAQSCSNVTQANCTAKLTGYQCAWESSSCVEKSYSCGDFTTADDCPRSIDCYWNKSGKCASFSTCGDYDETNCRRYGCKFTSGACASFTCSSYTAEADCSGQDSETTRCAWTTDGKCQALSLTATCTDLSNYKSRCESSSSCKYASSSCSYKTCADITNENQCYVVKSSQTEVTLCAWSGTACADAADTSKLTQDNCFETSQQNYRWSTDSKCVECSDLVSDDLSSNAVILSVFVALALIA